MNNDEIKKLLDDTKYDREFHNTSRNLTPEFSRVARHIFFRWHTISTESQAINIASDLQAQWEGAITCDMKDSDTLTLNDIRVLQLRYDSTSEHYDKGLSHAFGGLGRLGIDYALEVQKRFCYLTLGMSPPTEKDMPTFLQMRDDPLYSSLPDDMIWKAINGEEQEKVTKVTKVTKDTKVMKIKARWAVSLSLFAAVEAVLYSFNALLALGVAVAAWIVYLLNCYIQEIE